MPYTCPDCGATFSGDDSCQSVFDEFLVLEFTDPEYGVVHMLTVACFMIQHRRYSDAGLRWIERQLRHYLESGRPQEQIREQAASETDQSRRTWKVTRQPDEPPLPRIPWSVTIADVAKNYQDAASYCEWVRRWARATVQEVKPWLKS